MHGDRECAKIDICVCTFRRAELSKTLTSLADLKRPKGYEVSIIVVDNDVQDSARTRVESFALTTDIKISYFHRPAGNISIARNGCLDESAARFVVFIDDDETAISNWLCALIDEHHKSGAAVVLGPVKAHYEPTAPLWLQRIDLHATEPTWVKGGIRDGYSCNVLIDTHSASVSGKRFDLSLGRSGGEDTVFFHDIFLAGGRISFAPEAWLHEEVPLSRSSFNWLMKRRFRMGQTHGMILRKSTRSFQRWTAALSAVAKIFYCFVIAACFPFDAAHRNRSLLRGVLHCGTVSGLWGSRHLVLYGVDVGQAGGGQ